MIIDRFSLYSAKTKLFLLSIPARELLTPAKAPAAKKPKEPTLEEKPFGEFIEQHFPPALQDSLKKLGVPDLALTFKKEKLPLIGATGDDYWQVAGS